MSLKQATRQFTLPLTGDGATFPVYVGKPGIWSNVAPGEIAAGAVRVIALIDTGASISCISPRAARASGAAECGSEAISNPVQGGSGEHNCYQISIGIPLPEPPKHVHWDCVRVAELQLREPVDVLLGRDALDQCTFTYQGPQRTFTLSLLQDMEDGNAS